MTITEIIDALTTAGLHAEAAWADEEPATAVDLTIATGVVLRLAAPDYTRAEVHVLGSDGIIDIGDTGDPDIDTATVTPDRPGPAGVAAAWARWRTAFLTDHPTPWSYLNLTEETYIACVGDGYDWPSTATSC